jgi:hypothetical protein
VRLAHAGPDRCLMSLASSDLATYLSDPETLRTIPSGARLFVLAMFASHALGKIHSNVKAPVEDAARTGQRVGCWRHHHRHHGLCAAGVDRPVCPSDCVAGRRASPVTLSPRCQGRDSPYRDYHHRGRCALSKPSPKYHASAARRNASDRRQSAVFTGSMGIEGAAIRFCRNKSGWTSKAIW